MSTSVLITGANRGLGLALCQHFCANGAKVIAVCRTGSEALQTLDLEIIESVDVSCEGGMVLLKQAIGNRRIDILINNAGILRDESIGHLNYQQMLHQFQVNTLGPLRVVEALLENLSEGSKIALITSRMGSIEDNGSGGRYGYRMSKCALNAAGKSLAIDLQPQGIAVALLHPGYVKTQMVNYAGLISAEESAKNIVARIEQLNLDNSGTFWHANGEVLPW